MKPLLSRRHSPARGHGETGWVEWYCDSEFGFFTTRGEWSHRPDGLGRPHPIHLVTFPTVVMVEEAQKSLPYHDPVFFR